MAFCQEGAAAFPGVRACEVLGAFRWATARDGARKDAQVLLRLAAACPGHPVADEWAAPDAVRLGVRAKCRAKARDCRSAKGRGFLKAAAACLAVAAYWGARAPRDVPEQSPARQPLVALQKVVCWREPRRLGELVWLQVANSELRGEWVSARQAQRALRRLERPQALALSAWKQLLEPQPKQPAGSPDEPLAGSVWPRG